MKSATIGITTTTMTASPARMLAATAITADRATQASGEIPGGMISSSTTATRRWASNPSLTAGRSARSAAGRNPATESGGSTSVRSRAARTMPSSSSLRHSEASTAQVTPGTGANAASSSNRSESAGAGRASAKSRMLAGVATTARASSTRESGDRCRRQKGSSAPVATGGPAAADAGADPGQGAAQDPVPVGAQTGDAQDEHGGEEQEQRRRRIPRAREAGGAEPAGTAAHQRDEDHQLQQAEHQVGERDLLAG